MLRKLQMIKPMESGKNGNAALKFLLSFVVLAVVWALDPAAVLANTRGVVTADWTGVYVGDSTESELIGNLYGGYSIDVLDYNGDWFKVKWNDGHSFISNYDMELLSVDALVNGTDVNMRQEPSVNAESLGKLTIGDMVTIFELAGDFYKVDYNGTEAYIHKDLLVSNLLGFVKGAPKTGEAGAAQMPQSAPDDAQEQPLAEQYYAVVTSSNGVNLRIAPGTEHEIAAAIGGNQGVYVTASVPAADGDWSKVVYGTMTGYVKSEFLEQRAEPAYSEPSPANANAQAIVDYALQFQGTPYSYAGTSLTGGVDCSGFTYSVFKQFGINLNRSSRDQIYNGTAVAKSDLRPGDLLFFDTNGGANTGRISHVGLYIGNNKMVHASSGASYCVVITDLSEDYYINTYVSACRVLAG